VRDSVFQSCDPLTEFLEYSSSVVRVYRIKGWERASKKLFAWFTLEGRRPKAEEIDTPGVSQFLSQLDANPAAKELSSLPFYCDLLLQTFQVHGSLKATDEFAILDDALREMTRREYRKGLLDEHLLSPESFIEWLEELAITNHEEGGVSVEELKELAQAILALMDRDVAQEDLERIADQIVMSPFLSRSIASGRVEFAHEIIADYLASRRMLREFRTTPSIFSAHLGRRPLPSDSILLRGLARGLDAGRREHFESDDQIPPCPSRNAFRVYTPR
jgi:hypothetical protein